MQNNLECVPAPDGVSVAPCYDIGGVALVPLIVQRNDPDNVTFDQSPELFVWAFSVVAFAWFVGLGVGHLVRVVRSV